MSDRKAKLLKLCPKWIRLLMGLLVVTAQAGCRRGEEGAMAATNEPISARSEQRIVEGVVLDASGKPVSGADVWLTTTADRRVKVHSHSTSDSQGRFRSTWPESWLRWHVTYRQELGLVAHKDGVGIGGVGFSRCSVPPSSGVQVALSAGEKAPIQVLSPDGTPVAGASVTVTHLLADEIHTGMTPKEARAVADSEKLEYKVFPGGVTILGKMGLRLPDELSGRLTQKTDTRGNVVLPGVPPNRVCEVSVLSEAFGTQDVWVNVHFREGPEGRSVKPVPIKVVRLRPVGSLRGRLVTEESEAARGVLIRVYARDAAGKPSQIIHFGRAEVCTDAEGRFEVPAISQGRVDFRIEPPQDSPFRAAGPTIPPTIVAGQRTEIELAWKPGIRVTGAVLERGTRRPIRGVAMQMSSGNDVHWEETATDVTGRYECVVAPGPMFRLVGFPKGFLDPTGADLEAIFSVEVPGKDATWEMPPIEFIRTARVRGTVVNEDGKPVAGATVHARQRAHDHLTGGPRWRETTVASDPRGEFSLEEIDSGQDLRIIARSHDAATEKGTIFRPTSSESITLRLRPSGLIALKGKVREVSGAPVAGAKVEIWQRPWSPPPFGPEDAELVKFEKIASLITDGDGGFQTPCELLRHGEYCAVVRLEGVEIGRTLWLRPSEAGASTFPDVRADVLHAVVGRVLDRRGKPVPGATVFQSAGGRKRTTSRSDAKGEFCLQGIIDRRAFLFAEKEGFRFHGQPTRQSSEKVDMVLARVDEPPLRVLKTVPLSPSRRERLALARRVLEPALKSPLARDNADARFIAFRVLARIDPLRLLGMLEQQPFEDRDANFELRSIVVSRLATESPDDARAIAESIAHPAFRSFAYVGLCDAASDRRSKLDWLGQALVQLRAVSDPGLRLCNLSMIAKKSLETEQREQAVKLLREGQAIATNLGDGTFSAYAKGVLATELSPIDLAAALKLMEGLNDLGQYNRHHGNVAHKLAGQQPAAAEKVLSMVQNKPSRPWDHDWYAVRVCHRMAVVDLTRAKRIAASLENPCLKARAYGAMAQALAGKQPDIGLELLREAFAGLDVAAQSGDKLHFSAGYSAASVGAALLAVVEQIDTKLVDEFFWQAVSFRRWPYVGQTAEPSLDEWRGISVSREDIELATMLARFDNSVADLLLSEMWAQNTEVGEEVRTAMASAAAILAPHRCAAVLEGIADEERSFVIRCQMAKYLALEDAEVWDTLQSDLLGMWIADREDVRVNY